MASCQKVPKYDFQSQFSMSKIIQMILIFFSYNPNLKVQSFPLGVLILMQKSS